MCRQLDKEGVLQSYNGILLGHKKYEILTICDSMDGLEGIRLTKISQTKTNTM